MLLKLEYVRAVSSQDAVRRQHPSRSERLSWAMGQQQRDFLRRIFQRAPGAHQTGCAAPSRQSEPVCDTTLR